MQDGEKDWREVILLVLAHFFFRFAERETSKLTRLFFDASLVPMEKLQFQIATQSEAREQ
jgi:hypothetical protein